MDFFSFFYFYFHFPFYFYFYLFLENERLARRNKAMKPNHVLA